MESSGLLGPLGWMELVILLACVTVPLGGLAVIAFVVWAVLKRKSDH